MFPRVGIGYDLHRFEVEEKECLIKLCGVDVPHNREVVSNSDGDVAIHALVDAILGALCLGDIGKYFSPTDPQWNIVPSSHFLEYAIELITKKGYKVGNADIVIICERPKILPHCESMRSNLAKIMKIDNDFVSIKGKTNEKLGYLGEKKGIATYAIANCIPSDQF